jgi:DNA-binding GntR family transcriptional regulator
MNNEKKGTSPLASNVTRTMPARTTRTQLRDDAAAYARELIAAGQVRPGELLRLAPLAEHLGMSITPVREALLLLASEGWLEQEPHRGFRVRQSRRQDVEDTFLLLSFVSGEQAARAAKNIDAGSLAYLRELDDSVARLRSPDDDARAQQINVEIHREIGRLADSSRLQHAVIDTRQYVPRRFWPVVPGWIDLNKRDHRPIFDALERGSAPQARAAMVAHIKRSAVLLLAHLDSISAWAPNGSDAAAADGAEPALTG